MCKSKCILALFALCVGLVHSWDIAVTTGDQIEFYSNNTKIHSEGIQFRDLTALAYDAVYNMLLFVDKQSDNASIFSYELVNKKYHSLVRKKTSENIQGLTFDPVEEIIFWIDTDEKSIYSLSMKNGSQNGYGNLVIKMHDQIPRDIAVDSCRGFIYWTNINITMPSIERARFDGSDRKVLVNTDIYMPVSIAVDQKTKKLYWADDREGIHYSIESSDLDGKNRETLRVGTEHQPNSLTVSKNYIYWVDSAYKSVWRLPKNPPYINPETIVELRSTEPFGIAANYRIEEQTEGIPECEALVKLSQNKTEISDSFDIPADAGLFCVHGVKINGKSACKCSPGYSGERCDSSDCHNFCLHGDCSFTTDGKPKCRCKEGYIGDRCEVDVCRGYCLNNGVCYLNENHEPVCHCSTDHEGIKCEKLKIITTTTEAPAEVIIPVLTNNNSDDISNDDQNENQSVDTVIETCDDGWDFVRDPIIMVLAILCGLLCLACAVLITKILHLRRRPRIKKRIIVNKNVTPMTARPDQCEITIENCCNMNICETPCFEPRSTIRPTLLDSKPGKEEKRNLIANMEFPDDPY